MKKLLTLLAALCLVLTLQAESPQKISYQAVVRNSTNALVTNQPVGVKITILQGSATGTPVFAETHTPTTNANGLISITIGTGTPAINGLIDVDWAAGPYFIKTEIDPAGGTAYSITSTSELLSVPYALYAKQSESSNLLKLPFAGSSHSNNNAFSVKNNNGIAIVGFGDATEGNTFGVIGSTSSGVGIGISGINKSTSGIGLGVSGQSYSNEGVAIRGIATSSAGSSVGVQGTTNSANGYGVVGYAVSSSGEAKGVYGISNALDGTGVHGESNWIGVKGVVNKTTGYAYGIWGQVKSPDGIALAGFSNSTTGIATGVLGSSISSTGKGVSGENKSTTGVNYGVYGSTASTSGFGVYGESPNTGVEGKSTSASGATYGVHGTTQSTNGIGVFGESPMFGVRGIAKGTSSQSVGVFGQSMNSAGIGVQGISSFSGGTAVMGNYNLASGNGIGVRGFSSSPTGYSGYFSGGKFYVDGNIGIGTSNPQAGIDLVGSGFSSSFMFLQAPAAQDAGFRLYEGGTAKWHIFNSAGAGGLQIYNSASATAIFCKQSNSYVGIGTTTPAYQLQVGNSGDGSQARANAWNTFSDARLKKDFSEIDRPLEMVDKLTGYYYYWKEGIDQNRQVGFSAQEIRDVMPEVVSEGEDGLLSVEYGKITPLLLEAIKALKTENDRLKTENSELKTISEKNEVRMTEIENMLRDLMKK